MGEGRCLGEVIARERLAAALGVGVGVSWTRGPEVRGEMR